MNTSEKINRSADALLTSAQAARLVGCTVMWVTKCAGRGELPPANILREPGEASGRGRVPYLFREGDVLTWSARVRRKGGVPSRKTQEQRRAEAVVRTRSRRSARVSGLDGPGTPAISPERLQEAVQALPESFRETYVLISVGGLSYREAAAFLEVPVGTVRSRISRVRERLREQLIPQA